MSCATGSLGELFLMGGPKQRIVFGGIALPNELIVDIDAQTALGMVLSSWKDSLS
jgi:hypothetical protein